jgi:hypothetical protein
MNPGESSGLKAQYPIDLDAPGIEESVAHASRSPPPVSDDLNQAAAKAAEETAPVPAMISNVFQLEDAGMILLFKDNFSCPSHRTCVPLILASKTLVTLSTKDKEKEALQLEANPSASKTGLASVLVEPDTI